MKENTPKRDFPREDIKKYCCDNHRPIVPGDKLGIQQEYKILAKLGYSDICTVWLARDTRKNTYVVLKVFTAEYSGEISFYGLRYMYQDLGKSKKSDYLNIPADRRLNLWLDGFDQSTAWYFRHPYFLLPLMCGSLSDLLDSMPESEDHRRQFPFSVSKVVMKQVLQALALVHECEIAVVDLDPKHILIDIPNREKFDKLDEQEVTQQKSKGSIATIPRTGNGEVDKYLPGCVSASNLKIWLPDVRKAPPRVKLSNFEKAYHIRSSPPVKDIVGHAESHRAPELIFPGELGPYYGPDYYSGTKTPDGRHIDMWSFGCFMYNTITGMDIFDDASKISLLAPDFNPKTLPTGDDLYLTMMHILVGPLPQHLLDKWPNANKFIDLQRTYPEAMSTLLKERAPKDISDEDVGRITWVLQQIFKFNPNDRPVAKDLLWGWWFRDINEGY